MELTNYFAGHGKSQLDDGFVAVAGRVVENAENILPAGPNVGRLGVNNLRYASDDHVSDYR